MNEWIEWSHRVAMMLFGIGLFGVLIRRNAIVVLMCIEIMLNAINLYLVEIAVRTQTEHTMILFVFVITIAAAEAGVGLGIILNLYRLNRSTDLDSFRSLQG